MVLVLVEKVESALIGAMGHAPPNVQSRISITAGEPVMGCDQNSRPGFACLLEGILVDFETWGTTCQQVALPTPTTMPPFCGALVSLTTER